MRKEDGGMTTFTGKNFYPFNPNMDDVCIEDIAHHLALECRYSGACKFHYSVAQHCALGAIFASKENKLPFLLHDGAEAYFKDMVHDVKAHMRAYKKAEKDLQALIYQKFCVPGFDYNEIKRIDYAIMATEANVLMRNTEGWYFPEPPLNVGIKPWTWQLAEEVFLSAYVSYS